MIDERAIIDPKARLAKDVSVGPWSLIGADVEIGEGSVIGPHVVIKGPTRIGKNNHIAQFASIGGDPQDLKFKLEDRTTLEIGDNNSIREFCTISRGTVQGGGVTRVGNNNLLMAYVHVAHDCLVGNKIILSNTVNLAGHVKVEDFAIIGGMVGVTQHCTIGAYAFVCACSLVIKDIPPFVLVDGNTVNRPVSINTVGLKRHQFSEDEITHIREAYKILYRQGLLLDQAKEALAPLSVKSKTVAQFLAFLNKPSKQGIIR